MNCYESPGQQPARSGFPSVRDEEGPATCEVAGHGPFMRGGWGIRTPEGFHQTRFPNGPTGSRMGMGGRVCAGQRDARTGAHGRERLGLAANCYRNCYPLQALCATDGRRRWEHARASRWRGGQCCARCASSGISGRTRHQRRTPVWACMWSGTRADRVDGHAWLGSGR